MWGNLASSALGPANEFITEILAQKVAPVLAGVIFFIYIIGKLKNAIEARNIRHIEPKKYVCNWMTEEEINNLIEECKAYENEQLNQKKNADKRNAGRRFAI